MTESKLRRTIRRAILIAEGKKEAKKLAKQIKKFVDYEHNRDPEEAFKTCAPEALMEKFQEEGKSEEEIKAAFGRLDDKGWLHVDGQKRWFQEPY